MARWLTCLSLLLMIGMSSSLTWADTPLLPNAGFEQADGAGVPVGWHAYQWGAAGANYLVAVEQGVAHSGTSALRTKNIDASARGGVYTYVPLATGVYALSVWAKAEAGKSGKIALYLGTAYSRAYTVTDTWTLLTFTNSINAPINTAEINLQNRSGDATSIWFDDAELLQVSTTPWVLPNPSFEMADDAGVPDYWYAYQWGQAGARFLTMVEQGVAHSGANALRTQNIDAMSRGGVYTHVALDAGTYALSVWAKAEAGKSGKVAMYLGTAYSRAYTVTDTWTLLTFTNNIGTPDSHAEINLQNRSGDATVIWFDDVDLQHQSAVKYTLVPDTRTTRPRTLLFSPMNINYLRDTAPFWGSHGIRGFLFDQVMWSWSSDVWAADGDAGTRGADDALLQELQSCNTVCRANGIDANFVKVAFYEELPDWFDDAAWATLTEKFRQGARFAQMSGCAGIAIDMEYIAFQYDPNWAGYQSNPHDLPTLKAKVRERWAAVTEAMRQQFPEMVLLTLPEGMLYYGELYSDIVAGMLQALAAVDAPGGLHLLTEGTYHMRDLGSLAFYPTPINEIITAEYAQPIASYWQNRCSVAMGVWPLGYYREVYDANGNFLGYSGKKETFGDQLVGSYADKSAWYSPEAFVPQMAGVNTFCPRYNWIYGHGDVFWQWSEAQLAAYQQDVHRSFGNALLPTDPNVDAYLDIIAHPMLAVVQHDQPDLQIRGAADAGYTGNNIYQSDGTGQTKIQSIATASTATFIFRAQNDGNATDTMTLTGTAASSGWIVRYYAAGLGEITGQITGTGWSTGALTPGASVGLWVTMTPCQTVPDGAEMTATLTAVSQNDATARDVVKATATATVPYQPDLTIRTPIEATYSGDGLYNLTGTGQTKAQSCLAGTTVSCYLHIENDGTRNDSFKLIGTGGNASWVVRYFDVTGAEITAQMTGAGWTSPSLAVGGYRLCRVQITPAATLAPGARITLGIYATSLGNVTKRDMVKAVVTVQTPQLAYQPDLWLRTNTESGYTGNDVFTLDGSGQTKASSVPAGTVATYLLVAQNDGTAVDSLRVTGEPGDGNWLVRYFTGGVGEVTALVTGAGYTTAPLSPGSTTGMWVTVAPSSGAVGTKSVAISATSVENPAKKDVITVVTTRQ